MYNLRGLTRTLGARRIYTAAAGEQPAIVIGIIQGETDSSFTLTKSGELISRTIREAAKKFFF